MFIAATQWEKVIKIKSAVLEIHYISSWSFFDKIALKTKVREQTHLSRTVNITDYRL